MASYVEHDEEDTNTVGVEYIRDNFNGGSEGTLTNSDGNNRKRSREENSPIALDRQLSKKSGEACSSCAMSTGPLHIHPYLLPTTYVTSRSESIIEMAKEICGNETDEFEMAKKIRDWTQENIKYRLDIPGRNADYILEKGRGMCTNKATLQLAMMRAMGIPCAYGLVFITKKVYAGTVEGKYYDAIQEPTTHVFAGVFDRQHNRFRFVDATDNKKGSLGVIFELSNGESKFREEFIRGTISWHSNLDHMLSMESRWKQEDYDKMNERMPE